MVIVSYIENAGEDFAATLSLLMCHCTVTPSKNLGQLWLAYTELQGDFSMLQLISVDSRHFTQSELSLRWSDLREIKSVSFYISSLE